MHDAEAAGSCGRAGRKPTPPSSTAAPSHTPPRRGLRGVQATQSSRTSRHKGMPVCAAVGGPVSAAAATTSPPHCPRLTLGCQAWFRPPVGSATRSNSCGACLHRFVPPGAQWSAPAPLRSARATGADHPPSPPHGGCLGRCAPWLDEWSFTGQAVCCRVASRASAPAMAASGPAGEAGGRAALPCVPWQPHAAAGCCGVFLPPQEAQCNPGGATSRAGLAVLGAHAHP